MRIISCHFSGSTLTGILLCLLFTACTSSNKESPVNCCAAIGLDTGNLIGDSGVNCGQIEAWRFSDGMDMVKEKAAKKAMQCATDSASKNIPFIVSRQVVIPPDVSYSEFYLFTQARERVLMQMGEAGDGGFTVSVSQCQAIYFAENGRLKGETCVESQALYEQLKQK